MCPRQAAETRVEATQQGHWAATWLGPRQSTLTGQSVWFHGGAWKGVLWGLAPCNPKVQSPS